MDDFGLDGYELQSPLITMQFASSGRIQQLWVADPGVPDESEFQFVSGPMLVGEESIDEYFPGTILLGARTDPDEPWILSRNRGATVARDPEEPNVLEFEYDFPLIHELRVLGKFSENLSSPLPHVTWDITIRNRSRQSVEIGELGFPLALATVLEGYDRTDQGMREMFTERVYVHKQIAGAASYVVAQRMNGRPPGLVIFPGGETQWEFYNHVQTSLNTPFNWEGVPVVYIHSRATIEREGWAEWFNGHSSLVMEPGEERTYQIRFAALDRERPDNVAIATASCSHPTIRLLPSAVVPREVGIAVEVSGATPTRFFTDSEMADLESDSDDEGGFCFVRPTETGAVKLSFEDTEGRESYAHLLFIDPIDKLIQARAEYILTHQVTAASEVLSPASLPADNRTGEAIRDLEVFQTPFGIESSLADALFLAEKNTIYPVPEEVEALKKYVTNFIQKRFQNPGTYEFGINLNDTRSVATNSSRASVYSIAAGLYHSLSRVAWLSGDSDERNHWLKMAVRTISAMFRYANPATTAGAGLPLVSEWPALINDLTESGLEADAQTMLSHFYARVEGMGKRRYPFFAGRSFSPKTFDEASFSAYVRGDYEDMDRMLRMSVVARSMAACWWWYGSEKRFFEDAELNHPVAVDRGELTLAPSSVANAQLMFRLLDRDYHRLPEMQLRSAFGAMLSIWALVRSDGASAMGYCPDSASKQHGIAWTTGDVGLGLFSYLRNASSYVLPTPGQGVVAYGCHFEVKEHRGKELLTVTPWDGVGRRVAIRHLGFSVSAHGATLTSVQISTDKRSASVTLANQNSRAQIVELHVEGMWGQTVTLGSKSVTQDGPGVDFTFTLDPKETRTLQLKAK